VAALEEADEPTATPESAWWRAGVRENTESE
jgi:hypothetical protein